jgi:hypothetical protein
LGGALDLFCEPWNRDRQQSDLIRADLNVEDLRMLAGDPVPERVLGQLGQA